MGKRNFLLPGAGLEPARALRSLAPQASASANSATPAVDVIIFIGSF